MHWTELVHSPMTSHEKDKFPKLKHIRTLSYCSEFSNRNVELYETIEDCFIIETEDFDYLINDTNHQEIRKNAEVQEEDNATHGL